jgi:hypothetical protein
VKEHGGGSCAKAKCSLRRANLPVVCRDGPVSIIYIIIVGIEL